MMQIIKTKFVWLGISAILCVASIIVIALGGLKLGIDFTGGSILEVEYSNEAPSTESVRDAIAQKEGLAELGNVDIKKAGEKGYILRLKELDEPTHQEVLNTLKEKGELTEKSFESIGPVIGSELKTKSLYALAIALVMILLYIALVFRKVSRLVSSWKYGVIAIITLFHDLLIVTGAFALMGMTSGVEITSSFIAAFLTILGYSVNDTIVVFDRIRENLLKRSGAPFPETVNRSVNETLMRSINTSVTVLLVLVPIYLFGGDTLKYFSLALILGVIVGTYSSIFVASPLLVVWQSWKKKK